MKGAALILTALMPVCFGFWRGERIRREKKLFCAILSFFDEIQTEIRFFIRPAKEIFLHLRDPVLEKAGFLPALRAACAIHPASALKKAAAEWIPLLLEKKEWRDAVLSYTSRFGSLPLDLQLEEGEKLLSFLQTREKTMEKETANRIRISRMLGCSAGIGILILFW